MEVAETKAAMEKSTPATCSICFALTDKSCTVQPDGYLHYIDSGSKQPAITVFGLEIPVCKIPLQMVDSLT